MVDPPAEAVDALEANTGRLLLVAEEEAVGDEKTEVDEEALAAVKTGVLIVVPLANGAEVPEESGEAFSNEELPVGEKKIHELPSDDEMVSP